MGELVIDPVQPGLVVLVPPSLGLPGRQTPGIVRIRLEGGELRQGKYAALKGDLRRGQQLCVLGGELVFFLQVGDDFKNIYRLLCIISLRQGSNAA